jgi:hypothetical protein
MNNSSKKKLINKFNNQLTIIIILLIIFFFNSTNFFKNFVKVTKKNYDERIIETYGFCRGESIGFLKYLKNKYKFNKNPKIINYEHTPQVYWSIVNTKNINAIAKEKILLNYPGKQLNINLEKINDNLFEFVDLFFFSNNFDKLDKIIIKNNLDNNFKLLIYTKNKSNLKKIVKIIDIDSKSVNDLNIKFDNLDLNETRLFFEFQEKKITQNNIEINLILENKYIFKETEIIEKFNNCYYIK